MKRKEMARVGALVLALAASGCGTMKDDESGALARNTPLGRQWIFTDIDGFDGSLPSPPTNASFLMARESGRVVGSTSCNPLSGSFEINVAAGTLTFKNLENGSAHCVGANARTENAVIDAMVATDAFVLSGDSLSLVSKGTVVAHLTTP